MTPKQKLKSLEKKMKRLQRLYPNFDLKEVSRRVNDIQKYYDLQREHFHLEFEIEHCPTCGKKL